MRGVLDIVRAWLFPVACIGCDRGGIALCPACAPPAAAALRFTLDGLSVRALAPYEGTWRRAIVAYKGGDRAYAPIFGRLLIDRFPRRAGGDAVVPVATTRRRKAERGFDQAVELARAYGATEALDVLRKRPGPPQHGRDRCRRLALRGRFAVRPSAVLAGRRVVLVDDVCTTGATLRDAAAALRTAGVRVTGALVLATVFEPGGFMRTESG